MEGAAPAPVTAATCASATGRSQRSADLHVTRDRLDQRERDGVVYRSVATDPESGTITYGTTIGGADAARFVMNPVTREVRFVAS